MSFSLFVIISLVIYFLFRYCLILYSKLKRRAIEKQSLFIILVLIFPAHYGALATSEENFLVDLFNLDYSFGVTLFGLFMFFLYGYSLMKYISWSNNK